MNDRERMQLVIGEREFTERRKERRGRVLEQKEEERLTNTRIEAKEKNESNE